MKERVYWIDSVKAISMFAIVLGHTLDSGEIRQWLYGFHVPLFVIISGMLYKPQNKKDFKDFLKRRFISLMVPYYTFSLISILIYQLLVKFILNSEKLTIFQCLCGMIWANGENGLMKWNLPLWFLPMIFLMQMISFFVIKNLNNKFLLYLFSFSFLVAFAVFYTDVLTNLPFSLETVIYLFPFFVLGKLLYLNIEKLKRFSKKLLPVLSMSLLVAGTCIISIVQDNVDYVSDAYRNYLLFVVAASAISISIVLFFAKFNIKSQVLTAVGQNTLGILLMHKFPIFFLVEICPIICDLYLENKLIVSIVISVLTIAMCLVVVKIVERIFPWAIGKSEKIV